MSSPTEALTPTSYLVLGLLAQRGPATSYDLKQWVAGSIGYFWSFPHSQLYAEPARLESLGLLVGTAEVSGRKRRYWEVTERGRAELVAWLEQPVTDPTQVHDAGLLKLFFMAQGGREARIALAQHQLDAHRRKHAAYLELDQEVRDVADEWQRATLDCGLRFEQMACRYWSDVLERATGS